MFRCASVFSDNMILQRGKLLRFFGACEGLEAAGISDYSCRLTINGSRETVLKKGPEPWDWMAEFPPMDGGADCSLQLDFFLTKDAKTLDAGKAAECSITFRNVAFGEVFLAGGQSNMELELRNSADGKKALEACMAAEDGKKHPAFSKDEADIRYYYTQKRSYFNEDFYEQERNTGWQMSGDEGMKYWSAVAYFFAARLAAELKCPVGIIGCNWGGTSASCWMSRESLLASEETESYVKEYDSSMDLRKDGPDWTILRDCSDGKEAADRLAACIQEMKACNEQCSEIKTAAEQIEDYEIYSHFQTEWDAKSGQLYATVPGIDFDEVQRRIGRCVYPGPMNCASFLRPAGLYGTMIKRVAPYSLQGFIYYQGENDDHKAEHYYALMKALIAQWRKDWLDDKAEFILTQLPMHRYEADPDRKNWCLLREAQMKVADTVPHTGIAVAIDQGEFSQIHPQYKKRVGERLAWQALYHIYGKASELEAYGPVFEKAVFKDGRAEVTFRHARGFTVSSRLYGDVKFGRAGLNEETAGEVKRPDAVNITGDIKASGNENVAGNVNAAGDVNTTGDIYGFELAGADGVFKAAAVTAMGQKTVTLSCPEVAEPKAVRYLWTNHTDRISLYGACYTDGEPLPVAPFRS